MSDGLNGLHTQPAFKVPVTIGTMLNFEGDGPSDATCKQTLNCTTRLHNRLF